MRIISGKFAGRAIKLFKQANYRPSTAKLRGAMFNILNARNIFSKTDISVLDLFCGSGILSFEAISWGALIVTAIDNQNQHLEFARKNASILGIEDKIEFLKMNAENLPKSIKKYDLIFIDPPYYMLDITDLIYDLVSRQWLNDGAILLIETAKRLGDISKFTVISNKEYGKTKLYVMKYEE